MSAPTEAPARPVKTWKLGQVQAAVFLNQTEKGQYYSVKLVSRYKRPSGEWANSSSFTADQLPQVLAVTQAAQQFVLEHISQTPAAQPDQAQEAD